MDGNTSVRQSYRLNGLVIVEFYFLIPKIASSLVVKFHRHLSLLCFVAVVSGGFRHRHSTTLCFDRYTRHNDVADHFVWKQWPERKTPVYTWLVFYFFWKVSLKYNCLVWATVKHFGVVLQRSAESCRAISLFAVVTTSCDNQCLCQEPAIVSMWIGSSKIVASYLCCLIIWEIHYHLVDLLSGSCWSISAVHMKFLFILSIFFSLSLGYSDILFAWAVSSVLLRVI